MSETAATCPTCGAPATKEDVDTTPPGVKPGRFKTVYRAIPTPATDPLMALKEEVVEAAVAQHTAAKRYDTLSDTARRGEVFTDFMRATDTVARLVDQLKAARASTAPEAPR